MSIKVHLYLSMLRFHYLNIGMLCVKGWDSHTPTEKSRTKPHCVCLAVTCSLILAIEHYFVTHHVKS